MYSRAVLRQVAAISLVYDGLVGLVLLLAPGTLAHWFGVPPPQPRIFADLNALFRAQESARLALTTLTPGEDRRP